MKHYLLKDPAAFAGMTDLFVLTHEDLTESADNTAQAVVLDALNVGDVVFPNMVLDVTENANVVATVTASVGVTGALTQFIGNSNLLAAGSEHYSTANSVAAYVTTSAVNLEVNFIPGAADNLAEITAGEFWLYACISRKLDRLTLRQA